MMTAKEIEYTHTPTDSPKLDEFKFLWYKQNYGNLISYHNNSQPPMFEKRDILMKNNQFPRN
jgi:hypothetical protein